MPSHLVQFEEPMLADWIEHGIEPVEAWREVIITPPTQLVEARTEIDLGGRVVELIHLGRGHTDNDLLVHVPDAATWLAGDLIEESGPPMYGSGSMPLDWPETVTRLLARLTVDDVVVPGHGAPVDANYVRQQQADLQTVAEVIRQLHAAGVPVASAVQEGRGQWPFPLEGMANAVVDGYRQLGAD